MMDFRIGYGEDIHQLVEGRDLYLCGLKIPYEKGLLGHSDADVALHALSDALLGTLALGDIGQHFPPSDNSIKGIDSKVIAKYCNNLVIERGYQISNIDLTIIAEKPHLNKYILEMRKTVAETLEINIDRVSIKATTNEKLDAIGRGEAIRATAVVLIMKK